MKFTLMFIMSITALSASAADNDGTVGAAYCAPDLSGACHIAWKWIGRNRTYQYMERFDPPANRWWVIEESSGALSGQGIAAVREGSLYRVRACDDPMIDQTCASSTVFWSPYRPGSADDIPEIVVTEQGRMLEVSKNLPYDLQVQEYNLFQLAAALESVDPKQLPPMTAPERRWGATGFTSSDQLSNAIYDDYAGYRRAELPMSRQRNTDPATPKEFIADIPQAEWAQFRSQQIRAAAATAIAFSPARTKYVVTIFADISCEHCQQIMKDMDELNRIGIGVRFLAYPLAGPYTDEGKRMADVWCAVDRQAAFRKAIANAPVTPAKCDRPIVAYHYSLAKRLGIGGSPGIVTEHGEYIGGYLTPKEMKDRLDALRKGH